MRPWNGIGFAVIFLALAWSIDEYANVDGITEALNVDPHQSSELDGGQAASSQATSDVTEDQRDEQQRNESTFVDYDLEHHAQETEEALLHMEEHTPKLGFLQQSAPTETAQSECFSQYVPGEQHTFQHSSKIVLQGKNTNVKEDGTPVQKIETNEQELNFVVNITMLANTIHDGKPQKLFLMDVSSVTLKRSPDTLQQRQQESEMSEVYSKLPTDYEMLLAMQGPFYYRQGCDMRIHAVYHAKNEKAGIVSMKKGIAAGFSHHMEPQTDTGTAAYEVLEQTNNGPRKTRYQQVPHSVKAYFFAFFLDAKD